MHVERGAVLIHAGIGQFFLGQRESFRGFFGGQRVIEARFHILERDAVLRTLRSGQARLHGAQIQVQGVGEDRIGRVVGAEQALELGIGFDGLHERLIATRATQVTQRFGIDREEAARGTIFRSHVGDGGPIGKAHVGESGAVEFDEFPDHAFFAEHLGDGERQIRSRHSFLQFSGDLEADHFGKQHVNGLTQHDGFRLDAAYAPTQNAQAIDHGGVRIGAHERIGIHHDTVVFRTRPHRFGQILQVHLVNDTSGRRNHREIFKGFLSPAQELVALVVALELDLHVLAEREFGTEQIHLHRVIDHKIHRHGRIDFLRIATHLGHGMTKRGQIHHRRNAREILQHHAGRLERDFDIAGVRRVVCRDFADIVFSDHIAVAFAKHGFEQHFDGERKAAHRAEAFGFEVGDAVIIGRTGAGLERFTGA